MGVLLKDQHFAAGKPLYQVGLQKSLLIVGLGNPGQEYDLTRHNIGFYCLDRFAKTTDFPTWSSKSALHSLITIKTIGQSRVILCKPQTFMNDSGRAVQAVQHFYKVVAEDTLVVHDELDLPFGQLRLRSGGGSAGHNGIKSLIAQGSENSQRLRIGIGNSVSARSTTDSADFVLAKFSKTEQARLPELAAAVTNILNDYLASGQLPADSRQF